MASHEDQIIRHPQMNKCPFRLSNRHRCEEPDHVCGNGAYCDALSGLGYPTEGAWLGSYRSNTRIVFSFIGLSPLNYRQLYRRPSPEV